MNMSDGEPHILLFERDRRLASLITTELNFAGYKCHTAQTAVDVFHDIARYPVRLVLVNMARATATRREFWVALDQQLQGSGVQAFTFRCANLAGYGPHDPDEHYSETRVDLEVNGLVGLKKLVSAVQARVPVTERITSTMPRLSSVIPTSQNATAPIATPYAAQPQPALSAGQDGNRTAYYTAQNGNGLMHSGSIHRDQQAEQQPLTPALSTLMSMAQNARTADTPVAQTSHMEPTRALEMLGSEQGSFDTAAEEAAEQISGMLSLYMAFILARFIRLVAFANRIRIFYQQLQEEMAMTEGTYVDSTPASVESTISDAPPARTPQVSANTGSGLLEAMASASRLVQLDALLSTEPAFMLDLPLD